MKRMTSVWALAVIVMLVGDPPEASAASTYVQDNALTCQLGKGEYSSWTRDVNGIRNSSATDKTVYCPLTVPTYDSDPCFNPTISDLSVFYTPSGSSAVPRCQEYIVSRVGSTLWSEEGADGLFHGYARVIHFGSGNLPPIARGV
jgi:hypothetical protein